MADTAVYMVTHDRPEETKKTIELLRKTAGCDFDLFVADSGSGPITQKMLQSLETRGLITWLTLFPENVGQNIGANACLDEIFSRSGHEWVFVWSPDVVPKTRRALKKLRGALRMFHLAGVDVVVAPKVSGGVKPLAKTLVGNDVGVPYCEVEVLKGYARGAPRSLFSEWRFNVYNALAYGESGEFKERSLEVGMPCVQIENVKVKHVGDEPGLLERTLGYGL